MGGTEKVGGWRREQTTFSKASTVPLMSPTDMKQLAVKSGSNPSWGL